METNQDENKLFAIIIADGETISQSELNERSDNELLTRHFISTTAKSFTVQIGTVSELIYTLPLERKEFKGGRCGFAARAKTLYKKKTWAIRSNIVEQDNDNEYGVTVAVILPEPDATKPKLTWAMSPSTQLFSNTTARPTTKKIRLKGKQPRLNFHFIDMKKSSEAF